MQQQRIYYMNHRYLTFSGLCSVLFEKHPSVFDDDPTSCDLRQLILFPLHLQSQ